MSDADKTTEILDALTKRARSLIWATELTLGPKRRRVDFWAISPHPAKGYRATAYEVKVSRADFKRDTPDKQRMARLFSDEFYYVAPEGLIKPDEVPDWAGLQEWNGSRFKFTVHAPLRDKDAPTWELLTSIIRYSGQTRRDTDIMKTQLSQMTATAKRYEDWYKTAQNNVHSAQAKVRKLKDQLRAAGIETEK